MKKTSSEMERDGRSIGAPAIFGSGCGRIYWQPVKARLGLMATLVNGPAPVRASGGLEFTSDAEQVLVVMPSTA